MCEGEKTRKKNTMHMHTAPYTHRLTQRSDGDIIINPILEQSVINVAGRGLNLLPVESSNKSHVSILHNRLHVHVYTKCMILYMYVSNGEIVLTLQ